MLVFAVITHIIFEYIKQNSENKFSIKELVLYVLKKPKLVMGICIIPLGLFIYMTYLYLKVGDGLAFVHIQRAWGKSFGNIFYVIFDALTSRGYAGFCHALWAIWGFISAYHLFKQKRFDEAVLSLIFVVIPLSVKIQSIPRYLIGSFFPVLSMCDMVSEKNSIEIGSFFTMAIIMEYTLYSDWIVSAQYLC